MYDDLSDYYHLIYDDWPASIARQAEALDRVIGDRTKLVADVSCGIGTQSLGLAALGYRVLASDLAPRALERLQREAASRGLTIDTRVDDMTRLATLAGASVDVLLSCDNSVPHLLTDERILAAFTQFRRVLRPGGQLILSVRDYAAFPPVPVRFNPYGVRPIDGGKAIVFQVWEYEGDLYDLSQYLVFDYGDRTDVRVFRSRYYAVTIARLMELLEQAGFVDVKRMDDVLFQPVMVAVTAAPPAHSASPSE
ncbi:MAG TPA: class I SAM-dependent methyltransferase [Thermoanaerobaculia bacterium]|nr:class I SAM-dependent methyltransferase [Thermoanaerobaculia bacterium]